MDYRTFSRMIEESVSRNLKIEVWKPSKNASLKFTEDGRFKEFVGDTVVIPLDGVDVRKLEVHQEQLYNELEDVLAERLPPETFHVTVHDLNNPLDTPGDLEARMERTERMCKELFKELVDLKGKKIHMVAVGITGWTTAVGVAFKPSDEESFDILMRLHRTFHAVREIETFIPHVTLGYYKPGLVEDLKRILGVLKSLSDSVRGVSIDLDVSRLSYQRFRSMKDYRTLFTLGEI